MTRPYLITQGEHMAERNQQQVQAAQSQADAHIRSVAAPNDLTDQIARGKELLDQGAITPEEFATLKAKPLATSPRSTGGT